MGSEEREIGAAVAGDPVLASSPFVHEAREHHRLVLAQVSLHELLICQFSAVQPLYLTHDSKTHLGITAGNRSGRPSWDLLPPWRSDGGGGGGGARDIIAGS